MDEDRSHMDPDRLLHGQTDASRVGRGGHGCAASVEVVAWRGHRHS